MDESVECADCGRELLGGESLAGVPCPECGSTSREYTNDSEGGAMHGGGYAEASIVSGGTGRETAITPLAARVQEWASLPDRTTLLAHPLAAEFRAALSAVPVMSGSVVDVYRGQSIKRKDDPPSMKRMGPPDSSFAPGEGRYYADGRRALYLADSENRVRREMGRWNKVGAPYVVRASLPLTVRIADLSHLSTDDLISTVFWCAEMCGLEGYGDRPYRFSQIIAELVAERFDGMRVPGVRGEPGHHYRNIVLFHQLEGWPNWIDPARPPYRLSGCLVVPPKDADVAVAAYFRWENEGCSDGRAWQHWFEGAEQLS